MTFPGTEFGLSQMTSSFSCQEVVYNMLCVRNIADGWLTTHRLMFSHLVHMQNCLDNF